MTTAFATLFKQNLMPQTAVELQRLSMPLSDHTTSSSLRPQNPSSHIISTPKTAAVVIPPPTLITIPLEIRLKIFDFTLPNEVEATCCDCDLPPHVIRTMERQLGQPKLRLRLINKQAGEEIKRTRRPSVIAKFCETDCVEEWICLG